MCNLVVVSSAARLLCHPNIIVRKRIHINQAENGSTVTFLFQVLRLQVRLSVADLHDTIPIGIGT